MKRKTVVVGEDVVAETWCGVQAALEVVGAVERRVRRIPASEDFSETNFVPTQVCCVA